MRRGLEGAPLVVGAHHVHPGVLDDVGAHRDDGHPGFQHVSDVRGPEVERDQHDPVHAPVEHVEDVFELLGLLGVRVADERPVPHAGQAVLQAPGQHGIERVRDVREDERDGVGTADPQPPGQAVRPVPQIGHRALNPPPGPVCDGALARQHVGHGGLAHSRPLGDVGDGDLARSGRTDHGAPKPGLVLVAVSNREGDLSVLASVDRPWGLSDAGPAQIGLLPGGPSPGCASKRG